MNQATHVHLQDRRVRRHLHPAVLLLATVLLAGASALQAGDLEDAVRAAGIQGGLIVHLGCGDGGRTALLAAPGRLVHGLAAAPEAVRAARENIRERGLYGKVSVDRLEGARLPYIDGSVNLLVAEKPGKIPMAEMMRVLCPGGTLCALRDGKWTRTVKPRPDALDDWTHYLHDASNNAVSNDTVVKPPDRLQWIGGPMFTRHHDRMSGVNGLVSAGGRVFYIFDEAPDASILIPPKWTLIARDAFNGTIEWKRRMGPWFTHLWPLKSGPAQLPRRLVASGDRVYVTLRIDGPVTALDAATGKTVRTYDETRGTEEILLSDGTLFLLVNPQPSKPRYAGLKVINKAYGAKFWDEEPRAITAVEAGSGQVIWSQKSRVLPGTLAATSRGVFFHDGESAVRLDRATGRKLWRSSALPCAEEIRSFYLPILIVYEDVLLFSGGETAGMQTGSWYTKGKDTMTALSAETGKILWSAYHPPSGYRSPEDLLVVRGVVWTGETTSGRAAGAFTGRDVHTGKVLSEFSPDVETYWFHHRCYRGKATCNYLLTSRAGTEFIDVTRKHWTPNHWFRGACMYGVMPANGLLYAPQSPCACYLETKQDGFNALAPASSGPRIPPLAEKEPRLEKGPAYEQETSASAAGDEWPTYRHDAARSGNTTTHVPADLRKAWETDLGGKLTSPVIARGKVFTASVETHTLWALDASTGKPSWHYTAGGRIDSPPTVYRGRVLFGSADGRVYSLRASDGKLAWRFRAAPMDQRLVAFDQVESVWPVPGSVLVQDGVLYCVAGRSMFLDGGLRLWRLDPKTGRILSRTVLDARDPGGDKNLESYITWLNMPPALPDILSSDGRLVYMRSQAFYPNGTRLPLKKFPKQPDADRGAPPAEQDPELVHLFSPTGFLDDSYWHRSYWLYGSTFVSGWCGYFLAGKEVPAGKILVFNDKKVYGFGRKPQYYRWTTPIEHQLFAAPRPKAPSSGSLLDVAAGKSRIRVPKSKSLDPAGKPLTVEAWVRAARSGGVILARGGGAQGYTLYLQGGRPHFAVRSAGKAGSVAAREKIGRRWAHVAGVLTAEKGLRIYIDGKLAASAAAPGLVTVDPLEAMEIGADDESCVADYTGPFPYKGLIDEVRIYHRALSDAEIARQASAKNPPAPEKEGLVLHYDFNRGNAADASGNRNQGTIEGAVAVEGEFGRAMRFSGGGAAGAQFHVTYAWTEDLPIIVRAMTLADGTLFVAGPPDLVDEPAALRNIDDPEVQKRLAEQEAAIEGRKGALLMAVSAADGSVLARCELSSPPVFDGMAAASGKMYLVTVSGKVACLAGAP